MMNSYDLQRAKDAIMTHISSRGPSLPATISSELRIPLLFISAFLSELYREQKLMMSHLKVGTSSLYLLPGQEDQLQNFVQHLNQREREALNILKEKGSVKDSELSPVHRVAIREINDFAIASHKDGEICWQYAFAPKPAQVPMQVSPPQAPVIEQVKQIEQNISAIETQIKTVEKDREKDRPVKKKPQIQKQSALASFSLALPIAPLQLAQQLTPFAEEVKAKLEESGFAVQSAVKSDKKEAVFKASIQGLHGVQSYLVLAKDKKKLKEDELQAALQDAHSQRLLCLVLARGEPDKKTSSFISSWSNFLFYKTF